ncbi:hypothetical protein H4S03_007967 [Coemansia sp. S3946]|nr:hypothetical protein H4S03_007967 [Coemansia sp. S3946]KAJ2428535.1 hypothetical protein GGF41_001345 [Coemansia sp. RSA 2531]
MLTRIGLNLLQRPLNRQIRQVQQLAIRGLATSSSVYQPRNNLRSALRHGQQSLGDTSKFGQYRRIIPLSLVAAKPRPHEPSLSRVPAHISRPAYAKMGTPPTWETEIPILDPGEAECLRAASEVARDALALGGSMVRAGVTTEAIDDEVHKFIISRDAYPSCLNYMGFPRSICTSINNVIAHGIPGQRPLEDGDFVNIDITAFKQGFHGDTSATFAVGQVDAQGLALMDATRESLELAIQACGPGVLLATIGEIISVHAEALGYSVSQELTGHGIGRCFHQNPLIYHHYNEEPGEMVPGMAFTIEPILCQGVATGVQWPDGWTITTTDGGRSAQFEHTVLITDEGVEVLTA